MSAPGMSAKLADALRDLMNYAGGWDAPASHPCGKARDVLAAYDAEHKPAGLGGVWIKPRPLFAVTYDITTEESAADGDTADRGFIEEGATLRDAIEAVGSGGAQPWRNVGPCEAGQLSSGCRSLCFYEYGNGSRREIEEGEHESRTLHIPERVTGSSARRIARLLGCRVGAQS